MRRLPDHGEETGGGRGGRKENRKKKKELAGVAGRSVLQKWKRRQHFES